MKILVMCGGGISTNILAYQMKNYASNDDVIKAVSMSNGMRIIKDYDIVFVAPQILFQYDMIEEKCTEYGVACQLIDDDTYGSMDGETIMKLAREIIGNDNNKGERQKVKTLKITLACAGGVSTSILCTKIKDEVKKHGIDEIECNAYATSALDKVAAGSDVILLGPQVSYLEDDVVEKFPDIPVRLMDMRDYGTMNAKKIVDELFEEFNW